MSRHICNDCNAEVKEDNSCACTIAPPTIEELTSRACRLAKPDYVGGTLKISRNGSWIEGKWTYSTWVVGVPFSYYDTDGMVHTLQPEARGATLSEALQNLIVKLEINAKNSLARIQSALNNIPWGGDPVHDPDNDW